MIGKRCEDKTRYRTEHRANIEARKISDRSGSRFRCYRCDICHSWHLTSAAKKHTGNLVDDRRRGLGEALARKRGAPKAHTKDELEALAKKMRGG